MFFFLRVPHPITFLVCVDVRWPLVCVFSLSCVDEEPVEIIS